MRSAYNTHGGHSCVESFVELESVNSFVYELVTRCNVVTIEMTRHMFHMKYIRFNRRSNLMVQPNGPRSTTGPIVATKVDYLGRSPLAARSADEKNSYIAPDTHARTPGQEGSLSSTDMKADLMQRIKSYGLAGTLSYIVTELLFWAIAIPGAWIGEWCTQSLSLLPEGPLLLEQGPDACRCDRLVESLFCRLSFMPTLQPS